MYTVMATLQRQKGKYWYLVESRRVKGKPRPVPIAYLGKAEDILEKLSGKKAVSSKSYEYGTVAVLDHFINNILRIGSLFNETVFGRDSNAPRRNEVSFGQTMALIIMQRALRPKSKRAFSKWAKKTFLPFMYEFETEKLNSQHFWDMMDHATEDHIKTIELTLTKAIVDKFNIELDLLLYDYTNFFTFIDTKNKRNTIAQRGKNKQKRNDLRQFSLALMAVRGSGIPLFSEIYEGNKSDTKEFKDTIPKIKERLLQLSETIDSVTIVFDKGSNSKENFEIIDDLNYVASLSVWHDKDLREISFDKFYDLKKEVLSDSADSDEKDEILKCYRCKKQVWGIDRTIVMYKSEALFDGQLVGFKQDIEKTKISLQKLQESGEAGFYLKKGKKRAWTYELFERDVEQVINKSFVRDTFEFQIKKLKNHRFKLTYELNRKKYNRIKKTVLGKRILMTSRHNWNDEEIIDAYHGQHDVENDFRKIKNPFHNCVRPQFHWTDQKIMVHTFCSLLSLTASNLIEKIARENGFDMTSDEIFDRLQDIRKVKYIYPAEKKGQYEIEYKIEEVDDQDNLKLFNCLMDYR